MLPKKGRSKSSLLNALDFFIKNRVMSGNITREEDLRTYLIRSKCINRFPTGHVFSSVPT